MPWLVDVGAAFGERDLVDHAVEGLAAGFDGALGPGFADGGAEAGGIDLLWGREGSALGQAGEAELEVLALGAQGGVGRLPPRQRTPVSMSL